MGDKRGKVGAFLSFQPPEFWWPVASVSLRMNRARQEEEGRRTREGAPSCLMLKKAYFLAAGGEKHGPDSITR